MSQSETAPASSPPAAPAGPLVLDATAAAKRFELTPDFDFLREDVMRNPYPVYRQLQEEAPVFWSQQMDAWVITRN